MLEKNDIVKFYQLLARLDKNSTNVGVIRTKQEFTAFVKNLMKKYKGDKNIKVMINESGNIARVFNITTDVEISYIQIDNFIDLEKNFYRKYI